jgi:flagellar basal-body rod protein FlgF
MMPDAFITAIQSMQHDQRRMETVTRNMSNVATPGYQREIPVVRTFGMAFEAPQNAATAAASPGAMRVMAPGPLKFTGKPFDLAYNGAGYFTLQTPAGPAYTRAGAFHLDAGGRLVNDLGLPVMGEGGEIVVRGDGASVDAQGQVRQGGRVVARLLMAQFEHPGQLRLDGQGLLRAVDQTPQQARGALQIGYLEGANTNPAREMISMTETVRHFETAQKLYQAYDEQVRSSIQELGKF